MVIEMKLSERGDERLARLVGTSYVIAATGVVIASIAGLAAAVRWW